MSLSVICWMNGRSASTRLAVKGKVISRRNRACSGASVLKMVCGWCWTFSAVAAFWCGKPGRFSSMLTRVSDRMARCSACPVNSHGLLPSHKCARDSGFSAAASRNAGGGAKGHPAARGAGNSVKVSVMTLLQRTVVRRVRVR
jgi:hypothetical protein